jgi:hypothetical protein
MALLPPVSLVLDITALVGGSQREWREFSRVGRTHIPQAVYEEMRLLFDRSPDPDLEALCKAFNHFYPTSGWQITDIHAHHPTLTATGHGLTHRTRITLAAARCAYALALNSPTHLIVLVTRNQPMLQRMAEISLANLCAIDAGDLLQWSRTGQRPIAVSQKLHQLRATTAAVPTAGMVGSSEPRTSPSRLTSSPSTRSSPSARSSPTRPASTQAAATRPTPARSTPARSTAHRSGQSEPRFQSRTAGGLPNWASQLVSLSLVLGCLAIAGWLLWGIGHQTGWLDLLRQPLDPVQQKSN